MSRDPQVAAGPIALASADVIVLLAYFNLARLLLTCNPTSPKLNQTRRFRGNGRMRASGPRR